MLEKIDKDNFDKHLLIKNVKGGYGEYSVLEDISIHNMRLHDLGSNLFLCSI